jgi:hypothetical protein
VSLTPREELALATAMLLGAEPVYFDYGHPERAQSRKYWCIRPPGGPDAYGYTAASCAITWLYLKGYRINNDLTITKER